MFSLPSGSNGERQSSIPLITVSLSVLQLSTSKFSCFRWLVGTQLLSFVMYSLANSVCLLRLFCGLIGIGYE